MSTPSARISPTRGRKHTYCATVTVRRVWAAVSVTPLATVRELADRTGMPVSTIQNALRYLRQAGYVTSVNRGARTRVVLVPLIEVRR